MHWHGGIKSYESRVAEPESAFRLDWKERCFGYGNPFLNVSKMSEHVCALVSMIVNISKYVHACALVFENQERLQSTQLPQAQDGSGS